MARALKALIDCQALKHNLQIIQSKAPRSKIIAMIKANGYGHGLITVATAFDKAQAFGVACIEEARCLREHPIPNRIILMEGFFTNDELEEIAHLSLEPVVHHPGQIAALIEREKHTFSNSNLNPNSNPNIKIWIKIDTGMHRLGFDPEQFQPVVESLKKLNHIEIQGYLTHFSRADELGHPMTKEQMAKFETLTRDLHEEKSLANSAAILQWPTSHQDWVRPGIMLYGVSPVPNQVGEHLGLKVAMTVQTELIAVQNLKKGDAVGYGGLFVCPEPMKVGIVAVGYADGYPRLAPKGTPVLINGKRVPLVGRVSMDMLTVDLRGVPEANIGDKVILWGKGLPVEEVASHIGTLGYELLTGLSTRVPVVAHE